jgi:hypothetical protein
MKTSSSLFLLGLLLGGVSLRADSPPAWAARNSSGEPVRLAVPAPADRSVAHLSWPKAVRTASGTVLNLMKILGLKRLGGRGSRFSHDPAVSRTEPLWHKRYVAM